MIAVFNTESKKFLFFTEKTDKIILNNFLVREYPEYTNLALYDYIGDYDNGILYDISTEEYSNIIQSNVTIKHESVLKQQMLDRINTKHGYDLHTQLNIIKNSISKIYTHLNLKDAEFNKMNMVINAELDHLHNTINEYKEDPEILFVTEQEEKNLSLMQPPLSI